MKIIECYFQGGAPYGQLTRVGQEQMFALGRTLRSRYFHLIQDGDPSKQI